MPDTAALSVGLKDIEDARERVRAVAFRTPLVPLQSDENEGIHLKLENLQRLGSFKIRGAYNRMSRTTADERRRGFVTTSAGNHGQAVAWISKSFGSPCTVYVPDTAVARKLDSMRSMGARIVSVPHDQIMEMMTDDRLTRGASVYIHPFGDPAIVAGTGTIGLEIHEALPDAATVLVPVGGGGLSLGIATALSALSPGARVYGVQAEGAAPLAASFRTGRAERLATATTIADGIAASYVFDYMWPHLSRKLAGCLTVGDDAIKSAMNQIAQSARAIAEPAGASSLAAALKYRDLPRPVVCVVSGGNVDPKLFKDVTTR
ncbi:MAG TPA: threonine/serine dehydratase [Burkholderiales bacterium]|nr:threonine/serine dehydratase [Burkholderiales bacterium]